MDGPDQWGREIDNDHRLRQRAHFKPWALGGTDKHGENDDPKCWTLDSLMKLNGAGSLFLFNSFIQSAGTKSLFFITKKQKAKSFLASAC
jgi:hypothetical protein